MEGSNIGNSLKEKKKRKKIARNQVEFKQHEHKSPQTLNNIFTVSLDCPTAMELCTT